VEIVFVLQTIILFVLFVSMAFRMKGKYRMHGITMIVAVVPVLVAGSVVIPSFMNPSYTQTYTSPLSTFVLLGLHAFSGFAALIFGVWLVALWRTQSTEFAAKSKRIAQLTAILWVSSYVFGALLYVAIRPTLYA